jgi:hypothetical protein
MRCEKNRHPLFRVWDAVLFSRAASLFIISYYDGAGVKYDNDNYLRDGVPVT